jgi:hypothetical protein
MAAVADVLPSGITHEDLEVTTKRAIATMKKQDWLVTEDMKELMPNPGPFRKGRGLRVDWARTPWPNRTLSTPAAPTAAAERDENDMLAPAATATAKAPQS